MSCPPKLLLALLLVLVPFVGAADLLTFATVRVGKGYAGPVVVSVTWSDGTTRDMTGATGTLTAYSVAPSGGAGGTVLFTKALSPGGTTGTMTGTLTAGDTALPGSYYLEIAIVQASVTDTWHGTLVIEGF